MPELPEVETTTRGMRENVIGLTITDFWCGWDNILRGVSPKDLKKSVVGQSFTSVNRRGKNILAEITGGYTLIMHMKMTGHFMYGKYAYSKKDNSWRPERAGSALSDPYNRFVHVVFTLSDGMHLVFCDARKFGKIEIIKTSEVVSHVRVGALGPEPLDRDFTLEVFKSRLLKKEKQIIKKVLLDQTVIAGIGNIYADESLHLAGILPSRLVGMINPKELRLLYSAIITSLEKGLRLGGDSTSDYRNILGERGESHHTHNVYRQTGQTCTKRKCKGIIKRTVVAARGTHFCSDCQK